MASPENHHLLHLLLPLLLIHYLSSTTTTAAASDLTTLIYKGCANQNFQDPIATQNLKSLYTTLVSQSTTATYYKTTAGTTDQSTTTSITGLYQCRGDLSTTDCNTCVQKLPDTIQSVCHKDTIAARAQLVGCYMRYEVVGFQQAPPTELLYKKCSSGRVDGSGFDERLEAALSLVPKGVSNGKGYYAGAYQGVYVLGQCEGDLGGGECVNCVKSAVEIGRSECRSSVSGHVFLQQCYVSYTYYPDGVPGTGDTGGSGGVGGVETGVTEIQGDSGGGRNNTQKVVAIVFGGLAALGLVVAFLLVLKSAFKKKKEHYSYGGYS
ncbi:putative Gnk2-like domain-containing protein [Helianthus annuus]|uniref:Gnk2-like domain-containing protein n=1 Tax=Helianthus annuus TaxID=4232 RepID=A0A9K3J8P9_HELAN|nr:plasmodesmata-located protein 3 isoform X1 [Helianthus annuus]KAF5810494.1 putative Gnk2-like domain-containing protein [Helianthus annuus]KAJ0589230.1 putative Gnk2-like domain-containing protein [Helianthus annuus]KAJ0927179.1 putative Gnk2-like domain-containing protein [Helianthus annuus]